MLEIIEMHPDDKIVVKLPTRATSAECDAIRKIVKDFLEGDHKLILVNHDVEMVILRKTSEETVEIQTKEIP